MKRYQKYDRTLDDVLAKGPLLERAFLVVLALATVVGIGVFAVSRERGKKVPRVVLTEASQASASDSSMKLAAQFLLDEDYGAAIATYDKLLSEDSSRAEAMVGRGIAKARQGELESAIEDFRAASLVADWSEAIYINLGCVYTAMDDLDQAKQSYSLAIEANVDSVNGYASRARCLFAQQQFGAAVMDLSEAIRLAPEDPVLRANRAIAMSKVGQKEAAAHDMAIAVKAGGSDAMDLLLALFQLEAGMARECLTTSQQVLEQNPDAEVFHFLAGAAIDQLSRTNEDDGQVWSETFQETVRAFKLSPDGLLRVRQNCEDLKNRRITGGCGDARFVELESARLIPPEPNLMAAKDAYGEALQHASAGDLHTAIAFLNESLRNDPENHRSRQFRTMLLISTSQLGEAEYALGALTRDYPDDEEFQTLLAMVHSRRGHYQSSLAALDHAVRIQSDNPIVYANRALVRFVAKDDYAAVVKDCVRAERLGLQSAKQFDLHARASAMIGDFDEAILYHQKAIQSEPAEAAWLQSQCNTLLLQGDLSAALAAVEQALVLAPDDPHTLILHATCLYRQNDFQHAMGLVQRAKAMGVHAPAGDVLLARLLFKGRKYSRASQVLSQAVTQESKPDEQAFRAECHFRNKEFEAAWQWIQSAIKAELSEGESPPDKKKLLLASMIAEGRGEMSSAYDLLLTAIGETPVSQSNSLKLGIAAQKAGQWKESLRWLGKLIENEEQSPDAWHYAGVAFEKISQPINALKCYSQAVSSQPKESSKSRLGRARVLVALQRYREAIRDLNQLEESGFEDEEIKQLRSACRLLSMSGN